MSKFYKVGRSADWNYGGKNWKLSRSKIDLFLECPRCFYLDNKLGVPRPPGYPFNLNSAVDALLKKEFDFHRANSSKHPLMESYGIDAVPFEHELMDEWRENFKGLRFEHKELGFTISGALDDVWVNKEGELMVVDYKSTSKDGKIESLDEEWHDTYKRQVEVYQWLLKQNGFKVSNKAYFVYANASKDEKAFDGKLVFDVTLIEYEGDCSWVDATLKQIKQVLEDPRVPLASKDCDFCKYRESAGRALRDAMAKS